MSKRSKICIKYGTSIFDGLLCRTETFTHTKFEFQLKFQSDLTFFEQVFLQYLGLHLSVSSGPYNVLNILKSSVCL